MPLMQKIIKTVRLLMRKPPRSKQKIIKIGQENQKRIVNSFSSDLIKRVENFSQSVPRNKASTDELIRILYKLTDEVQEIVGKHAACTKGCSHCCHISVPICEIEAEFIARHTSRRLRKVRSNGPRPVGSFSMETPCNLLASDGTCSVYESRPFTCRVYHNLDADNWLCLEPNWNTTHRPMYGLQPLHDAYKAIMERKSKLHADVRDFFPAKVSSNDTTQQ